MKIIKWLFALVLAAGIFGVVGIYSQLEYIEGISPFYSKLLLQTNWLFPFFQIVLLLLAVLLLVLIFMVLAKHVSKKQTIIQRETGQLTFPLHTLESIAASAAKPYAEAEDIHTKVTLDKQDRAIVSVTLDGDQRAQFMTKSREIQASVKQALKNMADVETNRVDVTVKNTKKDMGLLPFSKKQSRVE
jgi:hypothetical protein